MTSLELWLATNLVEIIWMSLLFAQKNLHHGLYFTLYFLVLFSGMSLYFVSLSCFSLYAIFSCMCVLNAVVDNNV